MTSNGQLDIYMLLPKGRKAFGKDHSKEAPMGWEIYKK